MSRLGVRVYLGAIPWTAGYGQPLRGEWMLTLAQLAGWWERAQDGSDTSAHWAGVGQTASVPKLEARQIIGEGQVLATTMRGPGSLAAALYALARLSRTTLVVDEDDVTRITEVRVVQVQHTRLSPTLATVTISLVADDPLRYSAESRPLTNGTILLPNRGDATAFGRLTLTGPHGAISITHPGGTWTFPALASGSRLIDFRELQVWDGNARVFGEGAGPAPRVLPGGSPWTVAGLGAGSAVLSRAEAWS